MPEGRRYALEFRHESWRCDEVESACRERGVALAAGISDLDGDLRVPVTADFAYVRLRRDPPYSESEQTAIRSVVRRVETEAETLYLYVKHDGPGLAPDAVRWIRSLASDG